MKSLWTLQGWLYESLFALVPHRQLVESVALEVNDSTGRVLDAGCGTGRLGWWSQADVLGVDFSRTMLRVAARRGVKVAWADLDDMLPFPDGSFGQVVSINVLYAIPHPQRALRELARVLEPGGQLILATPTSSALVPLVVEHCRTASLREWGVFVVNLPRLLAWCFNLAIRGLFADSAFTFIPENELVQMVELAGLRVESVERCYAGIDAKVYARKEG